jgi:uncharacterized membrane protein
LESAINLIKTLWRREKPRSKEYCSGMPYHWSKLPSSADFVAKEVGEAGLRLYLSAHNSLTPSGFVKFISITSVMMLIPIFAFLGHVFLWIIAGTLGLTLLAVWTALTASWRRGKVSEVLEIWTDQVRLKRTNPDGSIQEWDANPYWTEISIIKKDGPVPNYLTLRGNGRTVELGSFLSEDERPIVANELRNAFSAAIGKAQRI